MKAFVILSSVVGIVLANGAMAGSPDYMMEDCNLSALAFFGDLQLRTEQKYEGQREDGNHAVTGIVYFKQTAQKYRCFYDVEGTTLVEFIADGKSMPSFVSGEGSPRKATKSGTPTAHADSDAAAVAATVRSFHAALASGDAEAAARLLAPDAVILESGGKETRKDYIGHHLLDDIKFAKAVPKTPDPAEITVTGDVAWASSTNVMKGIYQSQPLNLVGAELMILTRTPSGWQIRAIHWSSRQGG